MKKRMKQGFYKVKYKKLYLFELIDVFTLSFACTVLGIAIAYFILKLGGNL